MSPISFRKYDKSSFLEKPANWELLFNRTSTTRFTPASLSAVKNTRADFCVKPMVNSLISIFWWLYSHRQGVLLIRNPLTLQAIRFRNDLASRTKQLAEAYRLQGERIAYQEDALAM